MNISEKQLEDWICENPEEALWPGVEIIERQIPLRHGRLDILAFDARTLVIELKAQPIKDKDISQVLRYVFDVRSELQRMGYASASRSGPKTFTAQIYDNLYDTLHGWETGIESAILPVLVGTDIKPEIRAAASAAGVHVILWNYSDEFTFNMARVTPLVSDDQPFPDWVIALNQQIKGVCEEDARLVFDTKIAQLFGAEGRWPLGLPSTLPFITGVDN